MSGMFQSNLAAGHHVAIVKKKDQKSGVLTKGHIKDILTKKKYHSRGLKVRLSDGTIGRVQKIIKKKEYQN
ncbi:MAG: YwbE family protein [Clostridiales bacterium]|nr:YwbE family protein [Clostridiales bacterium]